ncbi:transcription factor bHLH110-like isoform X1 [Populus alba x Populus x berolinensis]|nr:transcription factor bHLH110-like isoform X1 [Populus alba x Populus x berolinensis]
MESANLHRQHDQLQDQFVGSSSLTATTPSSYAGAGSTHAWTQTITFLSAYHDLQLSKIKEELSSDSFPKFTEMLNSPSSTIEDPHPSSSSYFKDEQEVSVSVKSSFSRLFHPAFQEMAMISFHPERFPLVITTVPALEVLYPAERALGLDLLTSTRYSGSFAQPSDDPLAMFNKDSLSFGLDRMQHASQRPSCSPNKYSTLCISKISSTNEMTEAKRPNNSLMEPKATQAAATKKSRLESRVSCPPLKVRNL